MRTLSNEELMTITGGAACSILDPGCIIVEGGLWMARQIAKSNKPYKPLKCYTVGVTAYTCN